MSTESLTLKVGGRTNVTFTNNNDYHSHVSRTLSNYLFADYYYCNREEDVDYEGETMYESPERLCEYLEKNDIIWFCPCSECYCMNGDVRFDLDPLKEHLENGKLVIVETEDEDGEKFQSLKLKSRYYDFD